MPTTVANVSSRANQSTPRVDVVALRHGTGEASTRRRRAARSATTASSRALPRARAAAASRDCRSRSSLLRLGVGRSQAGPWRSQGDRRAAPTRRTAPAASGRPEPAKVDHPRCPGVRLVRPGRPARRRGAPGVALRREPFVWSCLGDPRRRSPASRRGRAAPGAGGPGNPLLEPLPRARANPGEISRAAGL